jgi:heptosyltransferase-1
MANRTAGSSYEAPTRWVADIAIPPGAALHAVQRSREVCARRWAMRCGLRCAMG